jgi:tungstate transport system substrate-binding protein
MDNHKFAYTLSDRGTWISFNKRNNLKIICEKFPPLLNQYGLIISNPENNPDLDIKSAKIYSNWLISDEGKKLINNFKIKGEQLFFYNHH